MSEPFQFETIPFVGEDERDLHEFTAAETESAFEAEYGRRPPRAGPPVRPRAPARPPRRPPVRPSRPPVRPPQPLPAPAPWGRGGVRPRYPIAPSWIEAPLPAPPDRDGAPAGASEFVRWVQTALNRVLDLRLPVTGIMDAATRSAVRTFQEQQSLPADGIVGPPTQSALAAAYAPPAAPAAPAGSATEGEAMFGARPCGCSGPGRRGGPCPYCGNR
jgi:hypothetical protein